MKNKPESYQSILAPYITGLLEEKRANGFSYTAKETTLWQFDEYCVSQHVETGGFKGFPCPMDGTAGQ